MDSNKIDILMDELKGYLHPDFYTKGVSAIERLIIAVDGKTKAAIFKYQEDDGK